MVVSFMFCREGRTIDTNGEDGLNLPALSVLLLEHNAIHACEQTASMDDISEQRTEK